MEWYFVVWYLAATGARVSELIQIKVEHVHIGYFDLYTKGGKLRRLYIPNLLKEQTEKWLQENNISFEREYRIDECKYKRALPFDFKCNNYRLFSNYKYIWSSGNSNTSSDYVINAC